MIKKFTCFFVQLFFTLVMVSQTGFSQSSVLVNFGDERCDVSAPVSFSFIKDPLGPTPFVLTTCRLAAQLPDYFSVFIAYNPKNQKIYLADIRTGVTKIWVLDMGLPDNIACPGVIPVMPTYSYTYVSNNFEFDKNGDLWSLSNYNPATGQCNIDQFDVNTGNILNTRTLQFPAGHFPSAISSGDLIILPNGRMFATMGTGLSQLYEINNYNGTTASATYLQSMPKDCFGLAYLNGHLEITGFDGSGCYFYDYNISSNVLTPDMPFQNNQTPIDNTSFSPTVGVTKALTGAIRIDAATADLVYEIYVKNMGNVTLNEINVTDDLGTAFGAGNVSGVTVNFIPGANAGTLTLNPFYNGTSVIDLLKYGQKLPNQTLTNQDYFFKAEIHCRVTNLNPSTLYLNSAVANATVGTDMDGIRVSDSSNNGNYTVTDPNNNGNPGDVNENIPTPFIFSLLPVRFINFEAAFVNKTAAILKWTVGVPMENAAWFEPEFSTNGINWLRLSRVNITDYNKPDYQFLHTGISPGKIYYRVKQIDNNGSFIYSKIILLTTKPGSSAYTITPNPADNFIEVTLTNSSASAVILELFDITGRLILSKKTGNLKFQIPCSELPSGTYIIKIKAGDEVTAQKLLISH